MLLEKQFKVNIDYTKALSVHQAGVKGGHNKETFMLNVDTFKRFCMKAGTKKADEIHDYFIKLENVLQEIIIEESDELKQQFLQLEDKQKQEYELKLEKQKVFEKEKILLREYGSVQCFILSK